MFSKLPGWAQATLVAAVSAVIALAPGLLDEPPLVTVRDIMRAALASACTTLALYLKANPLFSSTPKSAKRGVATWDASMWTAIVGAFLLAACAMFSADAKDPAQLAHAMRVDSEKACSAYKAAVAAGLTKPSERADASCRAVQGVCSEFVQAPEPTK